MPYHISNTNSELTISYIKLLLGAISYQYDKTIINKGYDPKSLRKEFTDRYPYLDLTPMHEVKFFKHPCPGESIDVTQKEMYKIKALINQTIGQDLYLAFKLPDDLVHREHKHKHKYECECSTEYKDITVFVIFYMKDQKFNYLTIKIEGISYGWISWGPWEYNDPILIENNRIQDLMGTLIQTACEEFGYDTVIKSLYSDPFHTTKYIT